MKDFRYMAIVAAAALGLAVAGCGSSGSDDTASEPGVTLPDPAIAERGNIQSAISMASTAVNAVDNESTDAEVSAAENAITRARGAIADADNVPAEEKAANTGTVNALNTQLNSAKSARTTAMNAADTKKRMEMAAAGKALHGALGNDPLGKLSSGVLASTGLTITPGERETDGTIAAGTALSELKAGATAGALGDWTGKHYAHTNTGTKETNTAIVWTNQAAPTTKSFASEYATGNPSAGDGTYTALPGGAGRLAIAVSTVGSSSKFKSQRFPTVGGRNYPSDVSGGSEVSFPGTYDGASGTYLCTTANAGNGCAAAYGTSGITLTGTWSFTHGGGAMVSRPDPNYLYFGWWLSKDEDDKPTSASAFFGEMGDVETGGTLANPTALAGTAIYTGHAAGKFAINNPLGGSDAGHFTANATLTAKFGAVATPTNGGISGTLDTFMANDELVPWSVKLHRAAWDGTNAGAFESVSDTTNTIDEGTTWSIDGKPPA